jgi:mercuric ion transport protein
VINSIWKHTLLTAPGIGVSLLPKLICPVCWPAYAGIVSSLGLGFLIGTTYLLPLTAGFLAVSAGALGFRARHRHGYGPVWMGVLAAIVVLVGKFHLESVATTYAGITLLVVASVWNIWPRRRIAITSPLRIERKTL